MAKTKLSQHTFHPTRFPRVDEFDGWNFTQSLDEAGQPDALGTLDTQSGGESNRVCWTSHCHSDIRTYGIRYLSAWYAEGKGQGRVSRWIAVSDHLQGFYPPRIVHSKRWVLRFFDVPADPLKPCCLAKTDTPYGSDGRVPRSQLQITL